MRRGVQIKILVGLRVKTVLIFETSRELNKSKLIILRCYAKYGIRSYKTFCKLFGKYHKLIFDFSIQPFKIQIYSFMIVLYCKGLQFLAVLF